MDALAVASRTFPLGLSLRSGANRRCRSHPFLLTRELPTEQSLQCRQDLGVVAYV